MSLDWWTPTYLQIRISHKHTLAASIDQFRKFHSTLSEVQDVLSSIESFLSEAYELFHGYAVCGQSIVALGSSLFLSAMMGPLKAT